MRQSDKIKLRNKLARINSLNNQRASNNKAGAVWKCFKLTEDLTSGGDAMAHMVNRVGQAWVVDTSKEWKIYSHFGIDDTIDTDERVLCLLIGGDWIALIPENCP